jgi:hypothetical protein
VGRRICSRDIVVLLASVAVRRWTCRHVGLDYTDLCN